MKTRKLNVLLAILIMTASMLLISCGDDDSVTGPVPTGNSKTYDLGSVAVDDISGTAEFIENADNSVTVVLSLQNTPAGGQHPAHIHFNTAVEGGAIAVSLGTVDGNTGISTITFSTLDDGTTISYAELLTFDGYINVHNSVDDLGTLVAQGDIGQNELTGDSESYILGEADVVGINGEATFYERVNGEALAVIALEGTPEGGEHPAHIHENTAAEGGGIAFSFNPVDGTSGISKTNVAALDNGDAFGYDDVLTYNGYINVHLSETELATIVAQGDIGQNELTGTSVTYPLAAKDVAGISGNAVFYERVNNTTLVVINLDGTSAGGDHPAHIHDNDAATTGPIAVTLTNVDGETGISKTQVSQLNSGTATTYAELTEYNGYINVHLSSDQLATLIAQGNIGSNVN